MERFQNVVRFNMVGHTHKESFNLSNSMTHPDKPVVVTAVGGSVTSIGFLNPSFRVIDFDAQTMLPVNMFTYYIDIDEANAKGTPDWRLLHDYLETYEMADLRPSNFRDLANRIKNDEDLNALFVANQSRQNTKNHD